MYYLHDKGANTSDRVAFVDVANMPKGSAERPERAFAHMIHTAEHANDLKRAAGLKAGRKMKDPVYSYSLSWHPSESPKRADMMGAAKETLAALGMADRQAVFIAHNDTEHPHIHVIVNRVCHETGRAHTMSNDRLILSDWALRYRKERGEEHFCPERAANKEKREQGNWTKHKPDSRADWYELKKSKSDNLWNGYRAQKTALKGDRKTQSDKLWRQKERRVNARKHEAKTMFRPAWRDMFKRQRQELKDFDASWIGRVNYILAQPTGKLHGLMMVLAGTTGQHRADLLRGHDNEKKQLSNHHRNHVAQASREVTQAWKSDRDQLFDKWKAQDKEWLKEAKAQSSRIWEKTQTADDRQAEPTKESKPNKARRSFAERSDEGKTPEQKAERDARAARRSRSRPRGGRGRSFTPD